MGILQRTKVLSNTKRKVRRRRHNLEKHWDMIATKAQLLGDAKVYEAIHGGYVTTRGGDNPSEAWTSTIQADTWMLQQMNIKPTSKSRERLRDALMRLRKQ